MLVINQAINVLALDMREIVTREKASRLSSNAERVKPLAPEDLNALAKLRDAGFRIALVTHEEGPTVEAVSVQMQADAVVSGANDKCIGLSNLAKVLNVDLESICFVGNADQDALAFPQVGLSLAPHDASTEALAAAQHVLNQGGAAGAVGETVDLLLALAQRLSSKAKRSEQVTRLLEESMDAHQRMVAQGPEVIVDMADCIADSLKKGGKILFCGNGGSAADCQHAAAELMGRYLRDREPLAALALTTDTSVLTAVGNDMAYAEIFSRQVWGLAREGDVVVGLSTSGKSQNIIDALDAARKRGAHALSLTGSTNNQIHQSSDICLAVPSNHTPRIQELHILALHSICELVEQELFAERVTS